ncbi:MBL fold metallo-hydrolase [Microgenomates group bacterium]|nr:MBL fold metallo-hydrolase [Microgenomates group bacterium]
MNKVTVLVEGYAREWRSSGWEASSSAVLVQTDKINIVCDPGINLELLSIGLGKEGLKFSDIDYVFLTHNHLDTCYSVGSFPKVKAVDYLSVYEGDKSDLHGGEIPDTNLKIIHTPGHLYEHCSLIVPTDKGIYVIAGGVFGWAEDEEQKTDRWSLLRKRDDMRAVDQKALRKSRKKVLEIANFVIPGYGKTFEV